MRKGMAVPVLLLAAGLTGCSRYLPVFPVAQPVEAVEDIQEDMQDDDALAPAPEYMPENPDFPGNPDDSDMPENPDDSDMPNNPYIPENPENPDLPEPETEPPTELPAWKREISDRAIAAYETDYYVHDTANLLSDAETEACVAHLKAAAGTDSNALLVITDDLAGNPPAAFAQVYYQALFQNENGVLVLLNNDTLEDYIYYAGTYRADASAEDIRIRILQATPCLVEGRYADALECMLS